MSFQNHFATQHVATIHDACASLYEHTDLTCFAFDITFPGGEFAMLTDQKAFFEPYYYQDLLLSCTDRFGRALPEGVYTHRMLKHIDPKQYAAVAAYLKSIKTTQYILVAQNHCGYQTLAAFGFNMNDADFEFFTLNHSEQLVQFLNQFKHKQRALIDAATQPNTRLHSPTLAELELDRSKFQAFAKKSLLTHPQPQFKHSLSDEWIALPKQQKECLQKTLQGMSSKKIADEMNLSVRTIDAYLAIIRKKLACRSTRELVAQYSKYKNNYH